MKLAAATTVLIFSIFAVVGQNPPPPPTNLRVLQPGFPAIETPPQDQVVIAGSSATFTVRATGDGPLSYQWTFKGIAVGSNTNVYTRSNCQLADNAGLVRVAVQNADGSVQSEKAILTVNGSGPNYYAATNGNTSNSGLTTNSPWPLAYAVTKLSPGATLTVLPGVYPGPLAIYNVSGTAQNPMLIRSQVKWQAIIANSTDAGISFGFTPYVSNLVLDGFCVSNSVSDGIGFAAHDCTVRNCWVVGNRNQGINMSNVGCSNNIVEYNLIENNGTIGSNQRHGIYVGGPNHIVRGNVVRNNNDGYGIQLWTGYAGDWINNIWIYDNLTYGHTNEYGVTMWSANGNDGSLPGTNYLLNNTILDGLELAYGTVGISNNIILPQKYHPTVPVHIYSSHSPTIHADYNLSTTPIAPAGPNDVVVSTVGFVNPGNGLYWLTANSPARGAASQNLVTPVDFFGNPQSAVTDLGAFQYSRALAGDSRTLTRGSADPDYWSVP